MMVPFTPGATATLSASGVSASVSVAANSSALEIQNAGSVAVFVRVGTATQTAVATDYPVLPGQSKIISKPVGADTLAGITAGVAVTVYVTSGEGF